MKPEERMKQSEAHVHVGPLATRLASPALPVKRRKCGDRAVASRKRWLEHQKKVTLAIVRLCAGGTGPRKIYRR